MPINDADREAANELRAILADICGFWHKPGDDSPICQALARHREKAEARVALKLEPAKQVRTLTGDTVSIMRNRQRAAAVDRSHNPAAMNTV